MNNGHDQLQLVCVSHRAEIFARHLGSCTYTKHHPKILYDNSVQNVAIPERYNHFITHQMQNGWVMFVHHDMVFYEDPAKILRKLPMESIYGAIGARLENVATTSQEVMPDLQRKRVFYGRIKCLPDISGSGKIGLHIDAPVVVDSVDCCCVIVHSSLIRRYQLRFDPNFAWHFYSEDFSLNAFRRHGIKTHVIPLRCGHFGFGSWGKAFHAARRDLIEKYHGLEFAATCAVHIGQR
jgi:hypothetical protein